MYKIKILDSAYKNLKKIPIPIKQKILDSIQELSKNPRPYGYKKLGIANFVDIL